jgi:hypothetical protein
MEKMKLFAGILLFGSLWGFSECLIGTWLSEIGLPAGVIMTGFFAITLLVMSRIFYRQPGMQLGMGLVAGSLRLFNPFVGCHLCSALAIIAEGAIFELIWYRISFNFKELRSLTMKVSMGVLTTYMVFVGGYIVTQILTPIVSGTGFYVENLIVFLPKILSSGLLPALIGGIVLPTTLLVTNVKFKIKNRLYYPTTLGISVICWIVIFGNWFLLA